MQRKIVAIGGGENGRQKKDGTFYRYETGPMDEEIIKLTNKEKPNFLFIGHATPINGQESYFKTMKNIYGEMYGCDCKYLRSTDLRKKEKVDELIEWADIIYEGGGNTLDMIRLWENTGFDKKLKEAWEKGKVMCGVSAGANCWFEECSSDSLRILYGDDQPLIDLKCLGFIKGLFTPHADEEDREESVRELLKDKDIIGFLLSNCTALEIVDDQFRIIESDASGHGIKPFAKKVYWIEDKYVEEKLDITRDFNNIDILYNKRN